MAARLLTLPPLETLCTGLYNRREIIVCEREYNKSSTNGRRIQTNCTVNPFHLVCHPTFLCV